MEVEGAALSTSVPVYISLEDCARDRVVLKESCKCKARRTASRSELALKFSERFVLKIVYIAYKAFARKHLKEGENKKILPPTIAILGCAIGGIFARVLIASQRFQPQSICSFNLQ